MTTTQIRFRTFPRLNATVQQGNGVSVVYAGGIYTVSLDFDSLAELLLTDVPVDDRDTVFFTIWDEGGEDFRKVSLTGLLSIIASATIDPTLGTIAALSPGANQAFYFTGADTAALFTLTSAARALLDDANASAMLTTLGVTDYAKTLLDDTSAAETMTTLGALSIAGNLSDIDDPDAARDNIGALAAADNLSDLGSTTTARTNLGVVLATSSTADPTVNEDSADGYGRGSTHVNTSPSASSGRFWITHSTGSGAATWYGLGVYKASNIQFGIGCGAAITSGINIIGIGDRAARNVTSGNEIIAIGVDAGRAATIGSQCLYIGGSAGLLQSGNSVGHTFIGFNSGAAHNSPGNDYNTAIGNGAMALATATGSVTCVGRSAGHGMNADVRTVAIGHATMYYGGGTTDCLAVGSAAGGSPIDGSGSNYGLTDDISVTLVGDVTGKHSAASRTNCFALGSNAKVPAKDNTGVLGKSLTDISTAARMWSRRDRNVVNNNAGVTLSAAEIVGGYILRTGSPGGGISDTTPTAAQIVAGGPGVGCESNVAREFYYNNATGQTLTLVGGSGVTTSGTMTVATGITGVFELIIDVSASGSEAVTLRRLDG